MKSLLLFTLVFGCDPDLPTPVAGSSVDLVTPRPVLSPRPARPSPLALENQLPGDSGWRVSSFQAGLYAYVDRSSYAPGDTVAVHAAADAATDATWELWRLGYYAGAGGRRVASGGPVGVPAASAPALDATTGMVRADWPTTFAFTLAPDTTTGVYLVKLAAGSMQSYAILIVRESAPAAPILATLPVSTYQAYNAWGGTSLYRNFRRDWAPWHAYAVSFDRPYANGAGAGAFFFCDRDFVTFAEAQGWDVGYAADLDLEGDPALLATRRAIVVEGHAEYFSAPMRDALEGAIGAGQNVLFFGANDVYWQVRFDPTHRVMTGYKEFVASDPLGTTGRWRDPPASRPENALLGEMFGEWVWSAAPLVVSDPNAWMWAGTELGASSYVPGFYGSEVDRRFHNGAEPAGLEVVGSGIDENHDGALVRAHTTIYTATSGAVVFDAGSLNWSRALAHVGMWDSRIQQATANLIARLTGDDEPGVAALAPMILPAGHVPPIWRAGTRVTTVTTALTAPAALAFAPGGDAVVVDGNRILRVTPAGVIQWVAEGFNTPHGVAVAPDGTIYVADTGNARIAAISSGGVLTTLAGSVRGFADGPGASARFEAPMGLARLSSGVLVVADSWNARIRAVTPSGQVSTLAGTGALGVTNGPGANAALYYPFAVTALPDDTIVFLEPDAGAIRKIAPDGAHTVSILAGAGGRSGWSDGPLATAAVYETIGIAATPSGDLLLLDAATYRVRVLSAGVIDTLAGGAIVGTTDGSGADAGFLLPRAAAVAPDGSIWIADIGGHALRTVLLALTAASPYKSQMAKFKPVWKLEVGDEAPDFKLPATGDTAGKGGPRKSVALSDYRGKKNLMLAFFPAAFTPV